MKLNSAIFFLVMICSSLFISCKKDKNVYAEDLILTVNENLQDSTYIGKVIATTEKSYLTYEIISQSPEGAIYIDESTGELFVKDKLKFNYETNTLITAVVEADNGKNSAKANVTININDVYEAPASIGDFRDGGIVFWVDPLDNTKGMVCAVSDQTTSAEWGCYDWVDPQPITGADGMAVGTGNQNTIDIEAGCSTPGTGADVCANLTLNGYSDWFLPSKDELLLMYTNKPIINAAAIANGGSAFNESVLYWSSSEYSADKAFDFYFATGVSEGTLKLNDFSIRAVRSF